MGKSTKYIILLFFLAMCLSIYGALASQVTFESTISTNSTKSISGSVVWDSSVLVTSCNCSCNATNLTINYTDMVVFDFNQTLNFTQELTHDGSRLFADDIEILLSNSNTTISLSVHETTENYVHLKFNSNLIVPEQMILSMYDSNYTFSVVDDMDLYLPIEIDYDKINWSKLDDNSINLTINYELENLNISDSIDFNFRHVAVPEVTLIQDSGTFRINDLLTEKLIIETRVPIFNVSVVSDKNAEFKIAKSQEQTIVYITPKEIGEHHLNYTITDYFGNKQNLTSTISIEPLGTHFFYSMNIPSIAVGERTKIKIFEHDVALPINYTLKEISFVPFNASRLKQQNITALDSLDIYMSDDSENNYFTRLNQTITITKSKTYFNVLPVVQGELYLRYEVQTPAELKSNEDFTIKTIVGNYSIFDTQKFDVAGVDVICELTDDTALSTTKRKCWTEFPLEQNYDNSLLILQERDYRNYEAQHELTLKQLEEIKENQIKKVENWLLIFIGLFSLVLIALLYVLFPRDWVMLNVKGEQK